MTHLTREIKRKCVLLKYNRISQVIPFIYSNSKQRTKFKTIRKVWNRIKLAERSRTHLSSHMCRRFAYSHRRDTHTPSNCIDIYAAGAHVRQTVLTRRMSSIVTFADFSAVFEMYVRDTIVGPFHSNRNVCDSISPATT